MKPSAMKTCVLILSALMISIPVQAQESGNTLAEKLKGMELTITSSVKGCDEDIKQHCDGLGGNSKKTFMCLAAYEDQLSLECREGIVEAAMAIKLGAAALDYSASACEADADKHCLDVQPGEGRIVKCIKANQAQVSGQCITALKQTGLWNLGN